MSRSFLSTKTRKAHRDAEDGRISVANIFDHQLAEEEQIIRRRSVEALSPTPTVDIDCLDNAETALMTLALIFTSKL